MWLVLSFGLSLSFGSVDAMKPFCPIPGSGTARDPLSTQLGFLKSSLEEIQVKTIELGKSLSNLKDRLEGKVVITPGDMGALEDQITNLEQMIKNIKKDGDVLATDKSDIAKTLKELVIEYEAYKKIQEISPFVAPATIKSMGDVLDDHLMNPKEGADRINRTPPVTPTDYLVGAVKRMLKPVEDSQLSSMWKSPFDDDAHKKLIILKDSIKRDPQNYPKPMLDALENVCNKRMDQILGKYQQYSEIGDEPGASLPSITDVDEIEKQIRLVDFSSPSNKLYGGLGYKYPAEVLTLLMKHPVLKNDEALLKSVFTAVVGKWLATGDATPLITLNKNYLRESSTLPQDNLRRFLDFISFGINMELVQPKELLQDIFQKVGYRTQAAAAAYVLLANSYFDPVFLQWATGVILFYINQSRDLGGSPEYKFLSSCASYQLLKNLQQGNIPLDAYNSIRIACENYTEKNGTNAISVTLPSRDSFIYNVRGPNAFSQEGVTVKLDLLDMMEAKELLVCVKDAHKLINKEIDRKKEDVKWAEEKARRIDDELEKNRKILREEQKKLDDLKQKRQAEQDTLRRQKQEEEDRRQLEEQERQRREEEARRQREEEAAAKERERIASLAEAEKRQAEEALKKRLEAEEAARQADEARRAAEEAKRQAQEEARKKVQDMQNALKKQAQNLAQSLRDLTDILRECDDSMKRLEGGSDDVKKLSEEKEKIEAKKKELISLQEAYEGLKLVDEAALRDAAAKIDEAARQVEQAAENARSAQKEAEKELLSQEVAKVQALADQLAMIDQEMVRVGGASRISESLRLFRDAYVKSNGPDADSSILQQVIKIVNFIPVLDPLKNLKLTTKAEDDSRLALIKKMRDDANLITDPGVKQDALQKLAKAESMLVKVSESQKNYKLLLAYIDTIFKNIFSNKPTVEYITQEPEKRSLFKLGDFVSFLFNLPDDVYDVAREQGWKGNRWTLTDIIKIPLVTFSKHSDKDLLVCYLSITSGNADQDIKEFFVNTAAPVMGNKALVFNKAKEALEKLK